MKELKESKIEKIIDSILEMANKERKESGAYKKMFKHRGDLNFLDLLCDTEDRMMDAVLNATRIIEERTGKKTSIPLLNLIMLLPFITMELSHKIRTDEGDIYSMDKTNEILNTIVTKLINNNGTV